MIELPQQSGAYRWYYADFSAGGVTAVFIFMVGTVFSRRYQVAATRGAMPEDHCSVNFALYLGGKRKLWVFSEHGRGLLEGCTLRIGRSMLRYDRPGSLSLEVIDRTAPWGTPVEASMRLSWAAPLGRAVELVEGQPHWWVPLVPRADAVLRVPSLNLEQQGRGYHDSNFGLEPLGQQLTGWQWARTHASAQTLIEYEPYGAQRSIHAVATEAGVEVSRREAQVRRTTRSAWGLEVPTRLRAGHRAPAMLETAPFYARLESEAEGVHVLGEVANFERFRSPLIGWMASFRRRLGGER